MKEQLIDSILQFLSGKISDEDITNLRMQIYYQLADYQVTKKCTDLAITPEKTYMDYLYMYLAALRMAGRSEKTLEHYHLQLSLMLHAIQKPVQDITTDDLFTYLAIYKNQRHVGNRYLDGKRVIFNGFFFLASEEKVYHLQSCCRPGPYQV